MKVSVLTMYEGLFNGEAKEVILPGEDGELSVWDNHQPCLYALRPGKITIQGVGLAGVRVGGLAGSTSEPANPQTGEPANRRTSISIKRGIIHIESNRLVAMVEI